MIDFLQAEISQAHPAFVEISNLLALAAKTWPRYGLSVTDLSRLDEYSRELIFLCVNND